MGFAWMLEEHAEGLALPALKIPVLKRSVGRHAQPGQRIILGNLVAAIAHSPFASAAAGSAAEQASTTGRPRGAHAATLPAPRSRH